MPTTATGRSSATTFLSRLRDPYALPTRFALVLACPSLASAQTGAPSDVSIYVFTKTDPSGFSDPFQAQRLESLETVKVTLKKRKGITVVEQADQADVHIEIINAGKLETGAQANEGIVNGPRRRHLRDQDHQRDEATGPRGAPRQRLSARDSWYSTAYEICCGGRG